MLHILHIRNFGVCKVNKKKHINIPVISGSFDHTHFNIRKKMSPGSFSIPNPNEIWSPAFTKKGKKKILLFARGRPASIIIGAATDDFGRRRSGGR
jgi:hypothetical protein